jgi:hypothetical protein
MKSLPVLFDPALLAFVPTLEREEFIRRISFLTDWAELTGTADANIHIAPEVREFLFRNGFYPAHDALAATIAELDLRYRYAPEDVIVPVNTIFNRAATGIYCCVKDEVHDTFTSVPPQPWHGQEDINYQSQRALLLARMEQLLHTGRSRLVMASLIDGPHIEFSSSVTQVDPDSLAGFETIELPKIVEGVAAISRDFEAVLDCVLSDELWATAVDNVDIKLAIEIRCREKLKTLNIYTSMNDIPEFFVGADFYASLVRNQGSGVGRFASLTLEGCASAVLSEPNFEWNDFDKAKRKADNAIPLRAHLSKTGPGMRLMAWHRPIAPTGRCLEFSNIGPKWEEEISDTNPTEAV